MSKYQEKIVDAITGEIIFRNFTEEEIELIKIGEKERDERLANSLKKESNRLSAIAKLAALGLTEDEIAAL